MPRALSPLLCLALLTTACESEVPLTKDEEKSSTEEVVEEEVVKEDVLEITFEADRETTVASSDYTLVDNTGYGFAYDASNVFDLDYSTAWCQSKVDPETDGLFAGGLTLTFTESPAGKIMGIVPGYARDEAIFKQNNRIKTLVLVDSASPILEDNTVYELEDAYEMQFIQLPADIDESFMLFVAGVYPGSKYKDTCIAEIDLWSPWVEQKDADAAYEYYLENKEAYALRPVGVKSIEMIFGAEGSGGNSAHSVAKTLTSCGQINYSMFESELVGNDIDYSWSDTGEWAYVHNSFDGESGGYLGLSEWMSSAGNVPAVSVEMNEQTKEGDLITIKWIDHYLTDTGELDSRLVNSEEVSVELCTDGSLYVNSILSPSEGEYNFWVTGEVEIYFNDRLLGQTDYSLPQ